MSKNLCKHLNATVAVTHRTGYASNFTNGEPGPIVTVHGLSSVSVECDECGTYKRWMSDDPRCPQWVNALEQKVMEATDAHT